MSLGEQPVRLLVLAADESVEVLEARTRRPVMERTDRRRLENRNFMALAKLRGRVAVEFQDLSGAQVLGSSALQAGAEVAISVMPPIPTEA